MKYLKKFESEDSVRGLSVHRLKEIVDSIFPENSVEFKYKMEIQKKLYISINLINHSALPKQ